jgi:predicted lipoprotein with Yx(FWY)xxD motif
MRTLVLSLAAALLAIAGTLAIPATGMAASKKPRLVVRSSAYGPMLFDGRRQAIYLFTKDARDKTRCYGDCARLWPPYLVNRTPIAEGDADQKLIGTIRRRDGRMQVTYRGNPLYFYVNEGPGQVFCHRVRSFGGLWLVVRANGRAAP